ncbi:olfactory receptor 8B3 [Sigmodon hispidus]
MGATGAEGFGPALCRADVKDARENKTIRDKDGDAGYNDVYAHHNENLQLINVSTGAGELHHREDVTEVVIDDVCITKGQSQHESGVRHGTRKCH